MLTGRSLSDTKVPNFTIFAGISGIGKRDFVNNFIEKAGLQDKVLSIDFEKELLSEDRLDTAPPDMPTYLDIPNPKSKLNLFESNFGWIAEKIDARNSVVSNIFLNMHLSYYKSSEFFPPFIPHFFLQLFTKIPNANVKIITLIDDVFSIWKKIVDREDEGYLNTSLRLREILAWRSLESLRAYALMTYLSSREEGSKKVTNYLVSIRHPFETFSNLIFPEKPIKVYLSYPISKTRYIPEDIAEINNFRKEIHEFGASQGIAVFDPVAIDELALESATKDSKDKVSVSLEKKHRWPIDLPNSLVKEPKWPISIPKQEIEEVSKDIRNQIASRDYTLVDSSHFLTVYRPYFHGEESKGVTAEIKHANEYGKKVIVFYPSHDYQKENPTTHPFGEKVDQFDIKEKFVEHLQKLITQKKERDK